MIEKLSKADQFLYGKIDNESKNARLAGSRVVALLESFQKKSFNKELLVLINHMKKIPTIDIVEFASIVEETGMKLQKFNIELSTHPELINTFEENKIYELLNEIQLFGTSCMELSKKALEFQTDLDR
jgi:hypothetical protein